MTPPLEPVILAGPDDLTVREGESALFQVRARGTAGITYQWSRDGQLLDGQHESYVLLPASSPADDGAVFSVTVTNGGTTAVESRRALLRVAPPLDLRFKWVGAPRTPVSFTLLAGFGDGDVLSGPGANSPVLIGNGNCSVSDTFRSCEWFGCVAGGFPGVHQALRSGGLDSRPDDWVEDLGTTALVTSLDNEEQGGLYAASVIYPSQAGAFAPTHGTVTPDQLQALADDEAAHQRIITALSARGGLVEYISYSWTREMATASYETKAVVTTLAGTADAATALATAGYVITAFGAGHDATDGVFIVGTRVAGDSAPRASIMVDVLDGAGTLAGYAVVGFYFDYTAASPTFYMIGEK